MTPIDLVVVLPGIMGSTLRHDGKLVWAPSGRTLIRGVKSFGRSVTNLRLPDGIGDEHPGDGVEAVGLMPDLHALPGIWTPVKGYDVLIDRLNGLGFGVTRDAPGNLLPLPYDWRLSIRYLGKWIAPQVEDALQQWRDQGGPYTEAQVVFVCHSMGGLVAREYIEHHKGAEITRKLITLGTPYRGAAKALVQLVNGIDPRLGSLATRLTEFARSLPSTHQLLPEYACIESPDGLAKTTETSVPVLDAERVKDAMRFHIELADAEDKRKESLDATHAIVGINQATTTTVRFENDRAIPLEHFEDKVLFGDSTVPLTGGVRRGVSTGSNTLRRIADHHGSLQRNPAALDELEAVILDQDVKARKTKEIDVRLTAPELVMAGEAVAVAVTKLDGSRVNLTVTLTPEQGAAETRRVRKGTATFDDLTPGAYRIDVGAMDPAFSVTASADVIVWD